MTHTANSGSVANRRPLPELNRAQWGDVVPINDRPAAWMRDALRTINTFDELQPGWDGGRSPTPSAEVLQLGRRIIIEAAQVTDAPAPHVGPVPGGGIQIEWHIGARDLELEVLPDSALNYLAAEGDRVAQDVLRVERVRHAKTLLEWLIR